MNRPANIATGNHKPHVIAPCLLKPENFRYHPAACGLPHGGKPVVMWTDGAVHFEGYEAGTHDGMRDGAHSGKTDMRQNFCRYATQEDWVASGNELPVN